jgi:hypothetical protein
MTAKMITGQLLALMPQPDTIAQIDNSALRKNTATLKIVFMPLLPKIMCVATRSSLSDIRQPRNEMRNRVAA